MTDPVKWLVQCDCQTTPSDVVLIEDRRPIGGDIRVEPLNPKGMSVGVAKPNRLGNRDVYGFACFHCSKNVRAITAATLPDVVDQFPQASLYRATKDKAPVATAQIESRLEFASEEARDAWRDQQLAEMMGQLPLNPIEPTKVHYETAYVVYLKDLAYIVTKLRN